MPNEKHGVSNKNVIILETKWNKFFNENMMIWKWEGNGK